jgi:hypothetical protein
MSKLGRPVLLALAAAIAALGIIAGATIDGGDDDAVVTVPAPIGSPVADDGPATEATIEAEDGIGTAEARRVGAAAVAAAGGGTVVEISRSDDPGETYEVEVITDRGEIDIALDDNLKRVANEAYDD